MGGASRKYVSELTPETGPQRLGRRGWWTMAPPEFVARVEAGIREGRFASDVHEELGLKRYCSVRAFRRWARAVRSAAAATTGASREPPPDFDIERVLLHQLHRQLVARTARPSMLAEVRRLLQFLSGPKRAKAQR